MRRGVWVVAALAALIGLAALGPAGLFARAESEPWPMAEALESGALAELDLDRGAAVYTFAAPSGSVYDVCLFPGEDGAPEADVELWQGGELLASGRAGLPSVSLRLTAGQTYTLRVKGAGRARLEVARHALSRCFSMPMPLDGGGDAFSKAFARAGDVHWYAVESEDALPVALAGIPETEGLRLEARLFDGEGRLLAEAARTVGGAFLLDFRCEGGAPRYLRVSALDGGAGLYTLRLARSESGLRPDRLSLSRESLRLFGRADAALSAAVSPADAIDLVYWESSDPGVARVDAQGVVSGQKPGTAVVTAYGAGGVYARCRVEVAYVPVAAVSPASESIRLNVGDDAAVECGVLPENASDPRLEYAVEPDGVVALEPGGVLRALAEGEATLTVRASDGGGAATVAVSVGPAPKRWRALLVGEQRYASTVAAVRPGSAHSVAGIRSMLGALSMEGSVYRVATLLDASRDGVLAAIDETFADAAGDDLSLLYITCHGEYAGGMTRLLMYDGSVLTAAELARALRRVPGRLLVILDCCGSGGAIGRAGETGDILRGIDDVFGGQKGPAALGDSRFMVLASAALEQDSYRISFDETAGESGMATVFARALCDAGGWSLDRGARGPLRADADYDGAVTLDELYRYTARRVRWYLELAGQLSGGSYAQTVQVWPEGGGETVLARTEGSRRSREK